MPRSLIQPLAASFQHLTLSTTFRAKTRHQVPTSTCSRGLDASSRWTNTSKRTFTSTSRMKDWLRPQKPERTKSMVGRPRMPTGGSMRGTTVAWGDYGLRMCDHDRRISAKQLQLGYETIQRKLRGMNFKIYTRVSANIGVYTKGNEVRMGKGKGKFDYWAARVPVNRVVFEVSGTLHEQVVREAFRLAGTKMPGQWEFVKKGDPPIVGMTKLQDGITLESLKAARRQIEPKDKEAAEADLIIPAATQAPPQTVSTSTTV